MIDVALPQRRLSVAVVGDARIPSGGHRDQLAFDIGQGVVDAGNRLITGGMGGVMEAAHRGARASSQWHEGAGLGLLPGSDPAQANPYVDIVIATGLDRGRNQIVAQSDAVIAIGGGAGTLSELAFAWIHRRLIIGLRCGGWSERLADQRIDARIRYKDLPEDRVFGADSARDALDLLATGLPRYTSRHRKIEDRAGKVK